MLFFYGSATPGIYTLSLHDALPIFPGVGRGAWVVRVGADDLGRARAVLLRQRKDGLLPQLLVVRRPQRSEEHTSELQSHSDLVCRLLLEKKKHHPSRADATSHKHTA